MLLMAVIWIAILYVCKAFFELFVWVNMCIVFLVFSHESKNRNKFFHYLPSSNKKYDGFDKVVVKQLNFVNDLNV